jgi:acetyl-CoA synthetase (ADP-forming)
MESVTKILDKAHQEGRKNLLEPEAKTICISYEIPVAKFGVAKDEEDAVKFAKTFGYPVVMKVVSPEILHKSDVGGVVLNVKDAEDVRRVHKKILENVKRHQPDAKISGVLVEEMAPSSTEVIVGAVKDPQFGATLMFGLGGVFVEILKDVTFRVAPIKKREAREMISELKAYPILTGYRGQPPADINAVVEILLNVSRLVTEHPAIKELDLNPVRVYEKGAKTLDARIILE